MAFEWIYPEDRETRIQQLQDEMAQHIQNYMRCRRLLLELRTDQQAERPLSLIEAVVSQADTDDDDLSIWRDAFDDGPNGLDVKEPA